MPRAVDLAGLLIVLLWLTFPRRSGEPEVTAETAVLRTIQAIHTAEVQYSCRYGRYAGSLSELGGLPNIVSGCQITLAGDASSYRIKPTRSEKTFCSNQTMVISPC